MKKLVVFDLDGTLCYTIEDIALSVNYALTRNGFPAHSEDFIKSTVGHSVHYMIEHCLPDGVSQEVQQTVLTDYMDYYAVHSADHVRVYDGICDVLKKLKEKGCTLAVVSNKPHRDSKKMVEKLFPKGIFDGVLGMMSRFTRKPCAEPLKFMLDYLDFEEKDCVYIGDSEVDIQFAHNTNVDCISCCWGYRTVQQLKEYEANHIISNPAQILGFVEKN